MVPAHGFEVAESVHSALAVPFPSDARHLHAPRALLEVMVGGQPQVVDGRIFFVQVTPVRLLADPERYAALHRELFGDEYYLPAPPLPMRGCASDVSDEDSDAEAGRVAEAAALADAARTSELAEKARAELEAHFNATRLERGYSAKQLAQMEAAAGVEGVAAAKAWGQGEQADATPLGVSAALSAAARALARGSDSAALSTQTKQASAAGERKG